MQISNEIISQEQNIYCWKSSDIYFKPIFCWWFNLSVFWRKSAKRMNTASSSLIWIMINNNEK